ncbi:MAG: hypothetical protein ABJP45_16530 [Cyclobacteriaceae bacterium]
MNKRIEKVVDRLILAQNIYNQLVTSSQRDRVREIFNDLLSHKVKLLAELSEVSGIDLDQYNMSRQEMMELKLAKIRIEINDLLTRDRYWESINFSIVRENKLINVYKKALKTCKNQALCELLESHSLELEDSLKKLVLATELNDLKN